MKVKIWIISFLLISTLKGVAGQQSVETEIIPKGGARLYAQIIENDTVYLAFLRDFYVFPKFTFKNKKQEQYYWKTVRDVKKTLPFAKLVAAELLQVNDKMLGINNKKEQKKYLSDYEKNAFKKYETDLKKMSIAQGQILMKLIDRECNKTTYDLVKMYKGNVSAFFWQGVAKVFGSNLKTGYDLNGKDKIIERVIVLVENGQL